MNSEKFSYGDAYITFDYKDGVIGIHVVDPKYQPLTLEVKSAISQDKYLMVYVGTYNLLRNQKFLKQSGIEKIPRLPVNYLYSTGFESLINLYGVLSLQCMSPYSLIFTYIMSNAPNMIFPKTPRNLLRLDNFDDINTYVLRRLTPTMSSSSGRNNRLVQLFL